MNEWEVTAFDKKDKTGAITTPTIRITLVHRATGKEIIAVLQRMSRIEYKDEKDKHGRVVKDKHYSFVSGWDAVDRLTVGPELACRMGIEVDTLVTMANLTLDIS
jgi:hypothetical protein